MKHISFLPLSLFFCFITACGNDDEQSTPEIPAATSGQAPTPPASTTAPAASATPAASGNALNPAHGQPGHRCDIAVGAPLNSPPATVKQTVSPASAAPVQSTPVPGNDLTPSKGVINTGVSANGLNPAHGQPGHRCDIAVGAPLNSQPSKQ